MQIKDHFLNKSGFSKILTQSHIVSLLYRLCLPFISTFDHLLIWSELQNVTCVCLCMCLCVFIHINMHYVAHTDWIWLLSETYENTQMFLKEKYTNNWCCWNHCHWQCCSCRQQREERCCCHNWVETDSEERWWDRVWKEVSPLH